jgi:hypothetical protein
MVTPLASAPLVGQVVVNDLTLAAVLTLGQGTDADAEWVVPASRPTLTAHAVSVA